MVCQYGKLSITKKTVNTKRYNKIQLQRKLRAASYRFIPFNPTPRLIKH